MATAFAIFCANDGSLTFYKRDTVPAVGDTFEGKVVGDVYTGFETSNYSSSSTIPWADNKAAIMSVSFVDEITPISTKFWFSGATTMTSFDGTNLNTSNVTNMQAMFNNCPNLVNLNVSGFDTGRVEAMGNMFSSCENLISLNISNFDTRNAKYMQAMFKECSSLVDLDVSNFNTSNVINMGDMFHGCSGLTSLDLSAWNNGESTTRNVTSMKNMFQECENLTSIDFGNKFDTSNVTNMEQMFYRNRSLTNLNLSVFNTRNVKTMVGMFRENPSLICVDLSSFDTSNVTDMKNMFYLSTVLTTIYVSDLWSTATVASSTDMFYNCKSLVGAIPYDRTVVDATHANYQTGYLTYKFYADYLKNRFVIDGAELFDIGNKIRTLTGSKEGITPNGMCIELGNVSDEVDTQADLIAQIQKTFGGTKQLIERTVTSINLKGLEAIGDFAFRGCTSLVSVDCPDLVTVNFWSFSYCTSLSSIDLPKVTMIESYGFAYSSCLENVILRNTEQVCELASTTAFNDTPIASGTGYIYVPSALIEDYKVATNWSTYAAQFRALEDYPDICGLT